MTLDLIELIIKEGTTSKEKELPHLEKAVIYLDLLKVFIRLAKDVEALDGKKYTTLQQKLQEIGRMIGGWKKSILPHP